MNLLKLFYAILICLPDILRLMKEAKKENLEQAELEKINNDFNEIDEAYRNRDAARLRAVFRDGVR